MLSESALTAMGIEHPETGMRLSMEYYPLSGDGNGKITSGDFILSGYFRDYTGRRKAMFHVPSWKRAVRSRRILRRVL